MLSKDTCGLGRLSEGACILGRTCPAPNPPESLVSGPWLASGSGGGRAAAPQGRGGTNRSLRGPQSQRVWAAVGVRRHFRKQHSQGFAVQTSQPRLSVEVDMACLEHFWGKAFLLQFASQERLTLSIQSYLLETGPKNVAQKP